MSENEASQSSQSVNISLRNIVEFVPPITIVTALLFYFGWARSDVEARQLGINESVLGMSVTDYLLRSISSLFLPIIVVLAATLAWRATRSRLRNVIADPRHSRLSRRLALSCQSSLLVLPGVALLIERLLPQLDGLLVPLAIALGVLLFTYGISLAHPDFSAITRLMVSLLVALMIFWELSAYAGVVGRGLADRIAGHISALPAVTVYAPDDLLISAPGVSTLQFNGSHLAYRFRYAGLRFLQYTGNTYFLLPDGWSPDRPIVIVIHNTNDIRVQFGTLP